MKKIILTLILFLLAGSVDAAAVVQSTSTYGAGGNGQSKAFASNVTAGNLIAVYYQNNNGTLASPTIVDSLGNTYIRIDGKVSLNTTGFLYYAKNILGGANTVTVTGADGADHGFHIMEISGLDQTDPLVASTTGSGSGTALAAPDITTGFSGIIYVGGGQETNVGATTPGAGYTIGSQETGHNSFDMYQLVTPGTYTVTNTSPSGNWVLMSVAFKDASGAAAPPQVTPKYLLQKGLMILQKGLMIFR